MNPTHRKIGLIALALIAVTLLFSITTMSKALNSAADVCLDYYQPAFVSDVDLISSRTAGDGVTLIEMRGDHRAAGIACWDDKNARYTSPKENCDDVHALMRAGRWIGG